MKLIDKKDKIFIAGGGGMVGAAIIKELINKGYQDLQYPSRKELDLTN